LNLLNPSNEVRLNIVNDLCDIWAVGLEARLVFAGPTTDYADGESLESFLAWIDNQRAM
jgi:hypothetical protein